jgi:hypothetical protein
VALTLGVGVDEVTAGVGEGEPLGLGVLVVGLGDGVGELVDGDGDGDRWAGADRVPWAGPTRLGGCTGWRLGANSSATAAIAAAATATTPPVAAPAANARRSRRFSVRRRSRSHLGRVARWAAQLLTGAAIPAVAAATRQEQRGRAEPCRHDGSQQQRLNHDLGAP